MKIMITGASGLLGRACRKAFADLNPTTCAWTRALPGDLKLDLTNAEAIRAAVEKIRPDLIIHTAAERKPDICENQQELTRCLNVEATRVLAESAKQVGAKLVYISTDYVFDGTLPPYEVDAPCNPINFYGQTKRQGEKAVLEASPHHVVLRVPILYGEVETLDESPVTLLVNKILNPSPSTEDHWATRYPTYVGDIAQTLRNWSEKILNQDGNAGIFHFSGSEALSKYEIVCAISEAFKLDHRHIAPNTNPPGGAPRPKDCRLNTQRIQQQTVIQQTSFHESIHQILTPFLSKRTSL